MLRLPYRAGEIVPPDVAAMLPMGDLAIGIESRKGRKRLAADTG